MAKRTVESCYCLRVEEVSPTPDSPGWPHYRPTGDGGLLVNVPDLCADALELTATELPTGGERWWLVCPRCDRRVECLYRPFRPSPLACRHCHRLVYRSSQKSDKRVMRLLQNPMARQRAIRRLTKGDDGPDGALALKAEAELLRRGVPSSTDPLRLEFALCVALVKGINGSFRHASAALELHSGLEITERDTNAPRE